MTNETTQTILARALGRALNELPPSRRSPPRDYPLFTEPELLELADHLTVALAGDLVLITKEEADALTSLERLVRAGRQVALCRGEGNTVLQSHRNCDTLLLGRANSLLSAVTCMMSELSRAGKEAP